MDRDVGRALRDTGIQAHVSGRRTLVARTRDADWNTLLTCSDLRNGTFTKTSALIAVPVPA